MITFKKSEVKSGEWHKPQPLTWHLERDYTNQLAAVIVCPNGHEGTLGDHEISHDGVITPSVRCPAENCNFHDFAILDGWVSREN